MEHLQLPAYDVLERGGALLKDGGRVRARVVLHDPSELPPDSLADRRKHLYEAFRILSEAEELSQVEIDLKRLSVAGQSVGAMIPLDKWSSLVSMLRGRGLKVEPRLTLRAV